MYFYQRDSSLRVRSVQNDIYAIVILSASEESIRREDARSPYAWRRRCKGRDTQCAFNSSRILSARNTFNSD